LTEGRWYTMEVGERKEKTPKQLVGQNLAITG